MDPSWVLVNHGKSPCLIGKPPINGPFSIAMLVQQWGADTLLHCLRLSRAQVGWEPFGGTGERQQLGAEIRRSGAGSGALGEISWDALCYAAGHGISRKLKVKTSHIHIQIYTNTDWWFGTCFFFMTFHILGIINNPNCYSLHHVSEG